MGPDELITIFKAEFKNLQDGEAKVAELTHKVGEALDRGKEKAIEFGRVISEKLQIKEILAPLAELGSVVGLIDLGKDALETAAKFDVLERKLAGVTGSFERAKQIMSFGEGEAGTYGIFGVEQLDDASEQLEAFGLKAEQYLPIVEKLGAVFGNGSEGLNTFAEAIGRIAEGDAGRAMMILERSGIGRQDLMKRGVQFKGEREVASSPSVVINAIEGAVNDKYGGVLKNLTDSPEAKAARVGVAWESAMRRIGQGIQSMLLPAEEGISKGLDKVIESGQLDRIVSGFEKLFHLDGANLQTTIQRLGNVIEGLPGKLKKVETTFGNLWNEWGPKILKMGEIFASLWVADKVLTFGEAVVGVYKAITAAIAAAATVQAFLDSLTVAGIAVVVAAGVIGAGVYASLNKLVNSIGDGLNGLGQSPPHAEGEGGASSKAFDNVIDKAIKDIKGTGDQQTGYLSEISRNTAAIAGNFKKYELGGGDLLRQGVSVMELRGGHTGAASHGTRAALVSAITQFAEEVAMKVVNQSVRNNYIPTR